MLGVVLATGVTVVLVTVQAPEEIKNLAPLAGVLPPMIAGLLKLFNRIDQVERNATQRARRVERKAEQAEAKADEAISQVKKSEGRNDE